MTKPIARFALNREGRDFIVGDIHGSFALLHEALEIAYFDDVRDRLFSVGDLIDRGRLSEYCLEFLRLPYVHAVRGNHEDMLLKLYAQGEPDPALIDRMTRRNGLDWWRAVRADKREDILAALRALPLVIEIQTVRGLVGIVHAEVPVGLDWQAFLERIDAGDEKVVEQALWGRTRIQSVNASGVAGIGRVFVGHTPQFNGLARYGNVYAIDTGAVFGAERGQAGLHLTVANIVANTTPLTAKRSVSLLDLRDHSGTGPFGRFALGEQF